MVREMIRELHEKIKECGLTPEQYEACLVDAAAKVAHTTDMDWQDIVEKHSLDLHYDTLRKASQTIFGGAFVSQYFKAKYSATSGTPTYLNELREERQALRVEKQKVFDERRELNKKLREQARTENDLSYLESLISERAHKTMPVHSPVDIRSTKDLFVCVSDFHFGAANSNTFGEYDSQIAAARLAEYLEKIVEIQQRHHAENVYVGFMGDLINGEIHMTTQLESRESLAEQVQGAAELLAQFIYNLSLRFKNVYVNGVAGNHSRTSYKDQVLRGNRLDNLIPWYIKAELKHIDNVKFIDDENYDSTIAFMCIRGNEYIMVHGDWDSFSEAGVSKLVMMIGYKPTAIFYGHMHHNSYDEVSDVKIIRSGGFSGTGDDYCISKRIYGKPGQMVVVLDDSGVDCCYPISFTK